MPSLFHNRGLTVLEGAVNVAVGMEEVAEEIVKRVNIPVNATTPPDVVAAIQEDPWSQAGKYALGWVYFALILLGITTVVRVYHLWCDRIRTALHKDQTLNFTSQPWPAGNIAMDSYQDAHSGAMETYSGATDSSTRYFFPPTGPLVPERETVQPPHQQKGIHSIKLLNKIIALFRWIVYRPIPSIQLSKSIKFVFPSLGVTGVLVGAVVFCMLYCFLPQPLYYQSMAFGSPPLAIRAGMLSVSLLPWVVACAAKTNFLTLLTGIGHERLIVLHRWGAYICTLLALIHAVPFWYQSARDPDGFATFKLYFFQHYWVFTTGVCALAPLLFLFLHSLPILRHVAYELFAVLHIPASLVFLGMMFWHCHNYLTSWSYLYATIVLMVASWMVRFCYLNWTNPFRPSWLIGEECAVTILQEDAVKVTIPTQKKWRAGQYVYLRMPGIAFMENHPFTIASLCSDDFPSEYGEQYRDMTLVFRPFAGFTRKLHETAVRKGPYKTYRAFIDGPYGGMRRQMASFDTVVFFAGGSGITALASQLLDLIKRMRDGKATTTKVVVIWAMKRPELMDWFKEELKICRECAPQDSVECHFFITASKRRSQMQPTPELRHSGLFGDKLNEKVNDALQGVASKRNSALMMSEEAEDKITELPTSFPPPPKQAFLFPTSDKRAQNRISTLSQAQADAARTFDFGFPQTPTDFQKNLMRFAFLPHSMKKDGWRTEYGRPDIPYLLKQYSKSFGRRTCVYVCGPPSMRIDVANSVAKLQSMVLTDSTKDEIYLHAENYAI